MIVSIEEYRSFIPSDESDSMITFRIEACESFICYETNNDFIDRLTGLKSYPSDVRMGAINMMKYDNEYRDKAGIASETLSRHSVSYSGIGSNASGGYPSGIISFLKPYYKGRF